MFREELRRHGDYLAARRGLLQLDLWRLASAYLVGLLLSLVSMTAIIATSSAILLLLGPYSFRIAAALGQSQSGPDPDHDIWSHPLDHPELYFPAALDILVPA